MKPQLWGCVSCRLEVSSFPDWRWHSSNQTCHPPTGVTVHWDGCAMNPSSKSAPMNILAPALAGCMLSSASRLFCSQGMQNTSGRESARTWPVILPLLLRRDRMSSSVDLPAPLGPSSATHSPGYALPDTGCSTCAQHACHLPIMRWIAPSQPVVKLLLLLCKRLWQSRFWWPWPHSNPLREGLQPLLED